jgi:hypothetical protein
MRFIQFKSSHRHATTRDVNISLSFARKKGACVIWISFDAWTKELGRYLWFGGGTGDPLPPLGERVARHNKADTVGVKAERPNLPVVGETTSSRSKPWRSVAFQRMLTLDAPVPANTKAAKLLKSDDISA